jgi:hypothetical protein
MSIKFGYAVFFICLMVPCKIFAMDIRISPVHGLMMFMNGCIERNTDRIYKEIFEKSAFNNTIHQEALQEWNHLISLYAYKQGKQKEPCPLMIAGEIEDASVKSANFQEFQKRLKHILPPHHHAKLLKVMGLFKPVFDELVGEPSFQAMVQAKESLLKAYKTYGVQGFLNTICAFHGVKNFNENQLVIGLYPVPFQKNFSMQNAQSSGLVHQIGVLYGQELSLQENIQNILNVLVHEHMHLIYKLNLLYKQKKIRQFFDDSQSRYAFLAQAYFDEGLATSLSEGPFYKRMHGKERTTSWYENPYIDGYAKKLVPLVEKTIKEVGKLDKTFIENAIKAFEHRYPGSYSHIEPMMADVEILFYGPTWDNVNLMQKLKNHFKILTYNYNPLPILSEKAFEVPLQKTTRLIIACPQSLDFFMNWLSEDQYGLKQIHKKINAQKSFVYSFFNKVPTLLFFAKHKEDLERLLIQTKDQENIFSNLTH